MKYFDKSEFNNFEMMDEKLLSMLDEMREIYGHPIKITSSYRSPEHPIEAAKEEIRVELSIQSVELSTPYPP